ncbi:uncharacterized protein TRIADDRAFT_19892 [Trichoplax adhaerens]|uniref:Uncharacterized protein n=1 Tax=Trichoplax adhaerens TaxID=10228 RepID=B3RLV1_TRIAD|nr:hypothetical protein TRIADDRAFT_19892 [Trichoplax adhaerens]EDV29588.1 hypothetical protein TRIADDRAFT_19892 [Trichoplax adhaerens]|eukprot:XP_002108790.1 hypothetical protein TRIADDRAFT_19892 [Trichoplax adhaerens]
MKCYWRFRHTLTSYRYAYDNNHIRHCSVLKHQPVLLDTVVKLLAPANGQSYIDATFGGGGHTSAILKAATDCQIYAIDTDPLAIARAKQLASTTSNWIQRLKVVQCRFGQMENKLLAQEKLPPNSMDGIIFDLGMSSMQIDDPLRGFSFQSSGPLDMRMDATSDEIGKHQHRITAAHVINNIDKEDLADVLWNYGEERKARAIATAIIKARKKQPITTTDHLVDIIDRQFPYKYRKDGQIHPATRTFQAIRILINDELWQLVQGLNACKALLKNGGRLIVISFHSLEDRIVKKFFNGEDRPDFTSRSSPTSSKQYARLSEEGKSKIESKSIIKRNSPWKLICKKPIYPSPEEIAHNSRARSAKLRCAIFCPENDENRL